MQQKVNFRWRAAKKKCLYIFKKDKTNMWTVVNFPNKIKILSLSEFYFRKLYINSKRGCKKLVNLHRTYVIHTSVASWLAKLKDKDTFVIYSKTLKIIMLNICRMREKRLLYTNLILSLKTITLSHPHTLFKQPSYPLYFQH